VTLRYKEATFPIHYRQAEVGQIMGAFYRLRSIAVTGLAGMGKSNVVRFIVSHPQVRSRYLAERADDYAFLHVDCAGLPGGDETEILNEVGAQLRRAGVTSGNPQFPQDPPSARRNLKEQILAVEPRLSLVIVLDYFDEVAAQRDRAFFNFLFHLRNSRPQGNICYLFATRRPMGHLYELQELLDDGCVVGPLNDRDALDSIQRDGARLGYTFDARQREQLIACSGGHPGFLKNTCELLAGGKADASLPQQEFVAQLLQSAKVSNLCRELWNDLTGAEQGVLANAARGIPLPGSTEDTDLAFLEQSGILILTQGERGKSEAQVFAALFAAFIRQELGTSGGVHILAVPPNQARIETDAGAEGVTLSPKLYALLLALTQARGQVLLTDEVIDRVYGAEAPGVTNAALSQLVKRLRGRLDPVVRRKTNDRDYTCVETIRDVGYRFKS
jgi:hypothetical protein